MTATAVLDRPLPARCREFPPGWLATDVGRQIARVLDDSKENTRGR